MIFRWSTAYARHLEAEILWLRTRAEVAEQKAAIAQAELVRLTTANQANVAPRPLFPTHEVPPVPDLDALARDPEWSEAGT